MQLPFFSRGRKNQNATTYDLFVVKISQKGGARIICINLPFSFLHQEAFHIPAYEETSDAA